jgi:hypothetical protein
MADQAPPLRFPRAFTEEFVASVRSQRGALHGVVMRNLRTLGFAAMLIERSWVDAQHPIDGGAMEIKEIDNMFRKTFMARGRDPSDLRRRYKAQDMNRGLAAVWIATPAALYYVTPAIEAIQRCAWNDLRVRSSSDLDRNLLGSGCKQTNPVMSTRRVLNHGRPQTC